MRDFLVLQLALDKFFAKYSPLLPKFPPTL